MGKFAEALREKRVYNTYDLLLKFGEAGRDFAICFTPHSRQTMTSFGVYLYSPRTGRLNKRFDWGFKSGREEAKAFAKERLGIAEWATCPTDKSTLIPKYVRDAAEAFVRAK